MKNLRLFFWYINNFKCPLIIFCWHNPLTLVIDFGETTLRSVWRFNEFATRRARRFENVSCEESFSFLFCCVNYIFHDRLILAIYDFRLPQRYALNIRFPDPISSAIAIQMRTIVRPLRVPTMRSGCLCIPLPDPESASHAGRYPAFRILFLEKTVKKAFPVQKNWYSAERMRWKIVCLCEIVNILQRGISNIKRN